MLCCSWQAPLTATTPTLVRYHSQTKANELWRARADRRHDGLTARVYASKLLEALDQHRPENAADAVIDATAAAWPGNGASLEAQQAAAQKACALAPLRRRLGGHFTAPPDADLQAQQEQRARDNKTALQRVVARLDDDALAGGADATGKHAALLELLRAEGAVLPAIEAHNFRLTLDAIRDHEASRPVNLVVGNCCARATCEGEVRDVTYGADVRDAPDKPRSSDIMAVSARTHLP